MGIAAVPAVLMRRQDVAFGPLCQQRAQIQLLLTMVEAWHEGHRWPLQDIFEDSRELREPRLRSTDEPDVFVDVCTQLLQFEVVRACGTAGILRCSGRLILGLQLDNRAIRIRGELCSRVFAAGHEAKRAERPV